MGRSMPSSVVPPNHTRRAERAGRAMETIDAAIPEMLRASPRARHGIHKAELIVDPPARSPASPPTRVPTLDSRTHIKIRLLCSDTLSAAARLSERPFASKRSAPAQRSQQSPNVAVLSFASPLRPGGGFLDGANSQEEFLCARTTLYPSLWDSYYRLPEVGGIHTPDVLVFRDSTPEANEIAKRDRYFVDVISAGMMRFPDTKARFDERDPACSCGVSYCDRDRELVSHKMRAVLRVAESKGCERLVLGAWGCGAYGNPVGEVAKIWRKVIAGSPRQRRPNAERWEGIKEIVFAVPDRSMLREFERAFSGVLATDPLTTTTPPEDVDAGAHAPARDDPTNELISMIAATEMQLELATNPRGRARLRDVLARLNRNLTRGLANKAAQEEDLTLQEDEEFDDFVVSGFPASGDDESNLYNFDEQDIASESSEGEQSEIYEFRPRSASKIQIQGQTSLDKNIRDNAGFGPISPSSNFDPQTGWFNGSMEQLTRMLKLRPAVKSSHSSPGSPMSRPDVSDQEIDDMTLSAYLTKYGGTDAQTEAPSLK